MLTGYLRLPMMEAPGFRSALKALEKRERRAAQESRDRRIIARRKRAS